LNYFFTHHDNIEAQKKTFPLFVLRTSQHLWYHHHAVVALYKI